MKRTISILTCTAMLIGVLAVGCSGSGGGAESPSNSSQPSTGSETIKIASLHPMTGGSATRGQQFADSIQIAFDEINAAGGVKSMNGAQLELVIADTASAPDTGVSQAERLITVDGVSAILGCFNSSVTFAVQDVVEKYGVPMVVMGAVKNEITERGYQYTFRCCNKASWDLDEIMSISDLVEEQGLEPITSFGVIYESGDWGTDTANLIKEEAAERGWECLVDESITTGVADMTPQVLKLKAAQPDVVFVMVYTAENILFNQAYHANGVNLKYGMVCGGAEDAAFFDALNPEEYEGMFNQDDVDYTTVNRYPEFAALIEDCQERNGYGISTSWVEGYVMAYIIYEAIEAAGSSDPAAIRDALANLSMGEDSAAKYLGWSGVDFDENGQNIYAHGVLSQRINGERVAVWPLSNRPEGVEVLLPLNGG